MSSAGNNKVAIVTGAAGALGRELVLAAALSGWALVLVDRNHKGLEELYDQVMAAGGEEPAIHVLDLSCVTPGDCEAIVAALENDFGRLDAIIHCAASFDGLQPVEQIAPQDWLRQLQINLNAPWLLSVSCLPLLRQSPQASLYFLSEDLEKVSGAYWGVYGISKHGIDALASQLAAELSNTHIQVLSINPGPLRSALRSRAYHSEDPGQCIDAAIPAAKILGLLGRELQAPLPRVNLERLNLPSKVSG